LIYKRFIFIENKKQVICPIEISQMTQSKNHAEYIDYFSYLLKLYKRESVHSFSF